MPNEPPAGLEARETLVVPLLSENVRLEPVERRGERDARLPPLARSQASETSGPRPAVRRPWYPRSPPGGCRSTGGRDPPAGIGRWCPLRGSARCRSISVLRPRRASNSRGSKKPAPEVTVAPRNSTRSCGLNERRTGPDVASPIPREPRFVRVLREHGLVRSPRKTKMWAQVGSRVTGRWLGPFRAGTMDDRGVGPG